jgi:hypothetical protein
MVRRLRFIAALSAALLLTRLGAAAAAAPGPFRY